jgi:hypothetical protein
MLCQLASSVQAQTTGACAIIAAVASLPAENCDAIIRPLMAASRRHGPRGRFPAILKLLREGELRLTADGAASQANSVWT